VTAWKSAATSLKAKGTSTDPRGTAVITDVGE
jgi:hypothetical protein